MQNASLNLNKTTHVFPTNSVIPSEYDIQTYIWLNNKWWLVFPYTILTSKRLHHMRTLYTRHALRVAISLSSWLRADKVHYKMKKIELISRKILFSTGHL